ncbi:MAG: response regulator [Rhodoferax sp.]|nr:response regulator [Rhodoferax sp.]
MSIFDRFWGTAKKNEAPPAEAKRAALGDAAGATAGTADRRNRKRKNARRGAKALIIDDSATVVAALRRILRSAGYITQEAMDAEQGLELVALEQPDLIFLDIILPGMNGFGALRAIRKDPATQHIPVIMISGNEHATEQFYANRIGADDFMKKPFSRFEVFARIENLLDASRVPRRKGDPGADPAPQGPVAAVSSGAASGASLVRSAAEPVTPVAQAGLPPVVLGLPAVGQWSALDARKELTAMGLQYFDAAQFFSAIRRNDQLAVELFLASGGVAVDEPLDGSTALSLAQELGRADIARMLRLRVRSVDQPI